MRARTRVKFCGITRFDDAQLAVELGVDALGFVFYEKSPRYVAAGEAAEIIRRLPPLVCKVGLFVDAHPDEVTKILADVPIDVVQFHGEESAAECDRAGRPYIKVVRMSDGVDLAAEAARFPGAAALLIDAYDAETVGGTGNAFDWTRVPAMVPKPIVLAGGLDASNVARAIATVRPYAVDVSSGIERDKGIKDPVKMSEFMQEVK
jgi:phosphoribosylanthranilate isomerase